MLYQSLCGKHHKYIHLAIIFIFLTLPPLARASQYIKPDLQPSSTFTLDNGLQVVFKHRPDTPLVELRLVVDAGMFESPSCPLAELPHLVEHLVGKPLEAAAPCVPRWWLIYVALVVGAALGWFSGRNMFLVLEIPVVVGRILTALLIGGGTQLIHRVVNQARAPVYPEVRVL